MASKLAPTGTTGETFGSSPGCATALKPDTASHITVTGADRYVLARSGQFESIIRDRHRSTYAEGVASLRLDAAIQDVLLLVPLCIQLHPSLLHAHGAIVLVRPVGQSGKVRFHDGSVP
jgi:hypothetical protein